MDYKEIEHIVMLVGLSILSIPILFKILKLILRHTYLPFIFDGDRLYAINPINNKKLFFLDESKSHIKNKQGEVLKFDEAFQYNRWLPCNGKKVSLYSLLCNSNGIRKLFITKSFIIEFYRHYYN